MRCGCGDSDFHSSDYTRTENAGAKIGGSLRPNCLPARPFVSMFSVPSSPQTIDGVITVPRIGGRFFGVRVSYRGRVRAYAGPKSLRISGGRGRTVLSSSSGPFTYFWTDSKGRRHRSKYGSDYNSYHDNRRHIMDEICAQHRCGLSSKEIADRLMERGIATPSGGKTWRASSVTRMLRTDGYEPNSPSSQQSNSSAGWQVPARPPSVLKYRILDNSKPVEDFIIGLYKEGFSYSEIVIGLGYAKYLRDDSTSWRASQVEKLVLEWRERNPPVHIPLSEWLITEE